MTRKRLLARGERGASLVLAIAFMLIIGAIGAAVLSMLTSGLSNRTSLDKLRDREYAADGAIQSAIASIRTIPASGSYAGPGYLAECDPVNHSPFTRSLNGFTIHVDCVGAFAVTQSLYGQQNVIFTACESGDVSGGVCPDPKAIIRAQVNFQAVGSFAALQIQRTWVQAWSVFR